MWKVQLFKLNYDSRELDAVADVLKSGWITMGEKTKEFELKFGSYLGEESKATAVSNGTAALHLALLALGIGPNDEVIIPGLTFVADINTVSIVNAKPVLADCTSLNDWNIDPCAIAKHINHNTKAVLIVHYAGYPCNMDAIMEVCKKHNLYLIEDCAHAPGAEYKGRKVGTFGDYSCFSFFSNKNLSVGEGGMVVTRSHAREKDVKYLRSHGMTALTLDRHKGRTVSYDVVRPGLNYRIDELRAALGLVQLIKLEESNDKRESVVKEYIRQLSNIDQISIPFLSYNDIKPAYHIFPVLLPNNCNRLDIMESLKTEGIQSSIHYPSFHEFSCYKDSELSNTPISDEISQRELTLPLYPTMTRNDIDMVVLALKKALGVNI